MFTFHKNRRNALVLPLWLLVPCLISCFWFIRTWSRDLPKQPPTISVRPREDSARLERRETETTFSLDTDNDGIPDVAELSSFTDRENFRRSLAGIAEMQFYRISDQWNPEQRDCAGLVRFAWREALRRHDRTWFQRMGPGYEGLVVDAKAFRLEQSLLGEKLFRTDFGSYKDTDLSEAKFSEFADARTLKSFNTKFISRDRRMAQPGDLIFYHQPWVQKFPYHVMIFVGESRLAAAPARDWVVYHTGASATDPGVVKKVELSVLDQHPNKRWRPVESNPNFLGFYRLKILD